MSVNIGRLTPTYKGNVIDSLCAVVVNCCDKSAIEYELYAVYF